MKKINLIGWLRKDSHEKQKVRSMRQGAALLLLLLICATHAWAYELNYPTLYFDNQSGTTWTKAMFFYFIDYNGSGRGSMGRNMEKITNTNLYFVQEPSNRGNDMSGFSYGFVETQDWGWEGGDNWSSRWTYACNNYNHSGSSQTNLPYGSYLCTSTGGSNLSVTKLNSSDDGSGNLKYDQTVNVVVNGNSSPSTSPAAITISSGYWTSKKAVTISSSNNITEGGSTISDTYSNAAYTATTTLTAGTPTSGYHFVGWYTAATGGSLISTSNSYTYYPREANTIYARFETRYSVTVNAGSNGTTTPSSGSSVTAGFYTSAAINASANPGYYFTNWTKSNDNVTFGSSTSTASNSVKATGMATVTANFAQRYVLRGSMNDGSDTPGGMPGWSATSNSNLSIVGNVMTFTQTLTKAKTEYKLKIRDIKNSQDKGQTGSGSITDGEHWTLNGSNDVKFTTTAAGVYTFTYDISDGDFYITFPDAYTITYSNKSGEGSISGTVSGESIGSSPGYAIPDVDVVMTATPATGYEFTKWVDGSDADVSTSNPYTIVDIGANTTIKAVFTPLTYKITFNPNGGSISNNGSTYEESSERKINATYDAAVSGTMPTAVKNGRHFAGWYTASGSSYKVINADGTWNQVTDYTDASKHWVRANNTTLYAHYDDPTLLSVDFEPKYAMPQADVTATISFNSAIGDPEGDYTLCCKLSTKSGTVLQAQPTITHDGVNPFVFTFTAPSSPGEYALQVKLFPGTGDVCGGNSPIATIEGGDLNYFDVEEMNPITITYECGGVELRESTTIYATWNNRATVTAPTIAGMKFDHWEYTNCTIVGGSEGRYNEAEATFYAFTSGSAKAVYTQGALFFKDTKNWRANDGKIYVYFYNARRWTTSSGNDEGTGSNGSQFISGPHVMTLLEGTDDVFYYDGDLPNTLSAVAFANKHMSGWDYFAESCEAVYAESLQSDKPMIVPVGGGAWWNRNTAKYYAHDKVSLLQDWGATVRCDIDSWVATHKLKSEKMGDLSFSTKIYLDRKSYNQQWRVYDGSGNAYGKNGTPMPSLTYSSPTSATLVYNEGNQLVKTNLPGDYIFTINYDHTLGSGAYDGATATTGLWNCAKVTVTYPVEVGDYRLVYDDDNLTPHPSDIIKKENNGETIVSMFYDPNANPVLKIQSCKSVATNLGDDVDPITWNTPTTINLSSYSTTLNAAGVYNFTITLDENGVNPAVTNVERYTGRFYVRTDCVNSDKWNYKNSKDAHAMTYSDYSTTLTDKPYSHYYVKDINGGSSNVKLKFTVATDYSEAITDTVINGDASGDYKDMWGSELLTRLMNVRFTYNQKTNKIWRAYTEGPQLDGYMTLRCNPDADPDPAEGDPDPVIWKSVNGVKNVHKDTLKFLDMGNWVYQLDAYGDPGVYVKLTADIRDNTGATITQYIKGIKKADVTVDADRAYNKDSAKLLISGSGAAQHMRIIYDFKTDRMTTAWLPSGTVSADLSIHADVMLLRKHQQGATSIVIGKKNLTEYAHLTDVEKAYGVMEFEKTYINDISLSRFERNLYWISFPFDVKLSDVFGFGKYGQHWIIEYYDGKGRAQKGYWADSEPNWKFVTEEVKDEFVLKANEGYILALALSNMNNSSSVWESGRVSSVYLYFPSKDNIGDITNRSSYDMPLDSIGYKCTITRDHRNVKDSYWHCIGVPSFALNTLSGVSTSVPGDGEDWSKPYVPYVYKWDSIYNTLSIASTSTFRFEAMKSYLIQYADDHITWANVTNKSLARRRIMGNEASYYEWNLNLQSNGKHIDHAYVRLSNDENVADGYDFGNDLSKEFNSGSNIYTFVDGIEVAGNVKPISAQTTVVPVGVSIDADGEYTFAMQEGTNGVGVVLIDNVAGTRTNLALEDYIVNLTAGTYNERFFLEISPIKNTPTNVEFLNGVNGANSVRKVMVDGMLYIVKDGKVFDAQGRQVK